ncbi:MAG: hypothetical protein A3E80_03835 [Chlamydiae bacterium RIFCSPHIGHO2_12_FULL_49_9]|nr:MAG: hypothetical protein A3E80_03835 [Chlamydiae bacterium RIFCSPHIGHO2_12_FULL_49_9]
MQRKFKQPPESDSSEETLINLTPLIDVVFVVLITFMLIAPILEIDSVDLASGSASTKKETPETSQITISVHADNSIWHRGQKVTVVQLEAQLREEKKRHPRAIPQLIHDKKAQFGTYQTVKNALENAGFDHMDVILKPS